MKLPNGNPPAPPNTDGALKTSRTAAPGQSAVDGAAVSARAQLEQLNLANRETALARVSEILNQKTLGATRLLLEVRGQSLTVNASVGETSLQAGDLVKIMRAGNELQLLGKLAPAAESTVARALAQRLPWQQSIDAGLAQTLKALTNGLKTNAPSTASPSQASATGTAQPLPAGLRQAIEQLSALIPNRQTLSSLATLAASSNSAQTTSTVTGTQTPGGPGAAAPAKPLESVAASQIRQWIEQSGSFTESRTARATDAPPPDLKLAIGRIILQLLNQQGQGTNSFNQLTPLASPELVQAPLQFPTPGAAQTPQASSEPANVGQMLRLLAGVLNRITVNQLHSQVLSARTTAEAPAPNTTLVVDLPWLNQNNEPRIMQLRVEENAGQEGSDSKTQPRSTEWRLSLAMNLDEAGPMHFDVSLGFGKVSAQVWAERQSTLQAAREHLPELRQSFVELGLEVTDLECRRGIPQGATTQLEHRLVDTRA